MTGSKAELRREMIARRDAMPAGERGRVAAALSEALARLPQYAAARSVLATMSIGRTGLASRPTRARATAALNRT